MLSYTVQNQKHQTFRMQPFMIFLNFIQRTGGCVSQMVCKYIKCTETCIFCITFCVCFSYFICTQRYETEIHNKIQFGSFFFWLSNYFFFNLYPFQSCKSLSIQNKSMFISYKKLFCYAPSFFIINAENFDC